MRQKQKFFLQGKLSQREMLVLYSRKLKLYKISSVTLLLKKLMKSVVSKFLLSLDKANGFVLLIGSIINKTGLLTDKAAALYRLFVTFLTDPGSILPLLFSRSFFLSFESFFELLFNDQAQRKILIFHDQVVV